MTQAQLLEQTTGEKQIKTEQLLEQIQVKETPFTIVGSKEQGYMITLGKYKLTTIQKTIKQCQLLIDKRDYELLFAMIGVAIEETLNIKQQDKNLEHLKEKLTEQEYNEIIK